MRRTARKCAAIDRTLSPDLIARFRVELERLQAESGRLGVAVSGGPDSLALLLLAQAAMPGKVSAATVDHGLRPESAQEAAFVASLCQELDVPHEVLTVDVPPGNLQANARAARYRALGAWLDIEGLGAIATAHHADDQAETLVMRLNRGSGLSGLAGIRADTVIAGHGGRLIRPLLGWRKVELEDLVHACGIEPVLDPSNANEEFDRVRIRKALAKADWLDISAIAQSASHLQELDTELAVLAQREWETCVTFVGDQVAYQPSADGLRMTRQRILTRAIAELGGELPRGSQVAALLDALERGEGGNLAGVLAKSGKEGWVLRREPPRH
ncbi:tRNA lysidine(34) synthetase TilS [Altererythrobacter sp.]|uniref:tRNA lysidine(34) synthetase TilS n=1 Tax=Altererythrobacter sp. TaxID=1872480 RepID=UPI003D0D587D